MTTSINQSPSLNRADVVAVIRAPLEQYPPTLNQVALLSESGLKVAVVDARHDDYQLADFRFPERVHRIHAVEHNQSFKDRPLSAIEKIRRSLQFRRCVHSTIRQQNPSVVIAYDPNAMAAVGKIWKRRNRPKLIWHFHELFLPQNAGRGWMTQRSIRFAANQCEHSDLVIFPDVDRARVYRDQLRRTFDELIVMNCPRRLGNVPSDRLGPALRSLGVPVKSPIVLFQGWIGPSRCFEAVIRSMSHWPQNAVFVLIGPVSDHYKKSLAALADQTGVGARLHFMGTVPYQELPSWTVGGTVGLSIVSDDIEEDPSWRYTAGAVNKRFEYMSVGLPQVANIGPGMRQLIEDTNTGLLADPNDVTEIGRQIASMLCTQERVQQVAHNARKMHLESFCYEQQFKIALHVINSWCGISHARLSPPSLPKKDVA